MNDNQLIYKAILRLHETTGIRAELMANKRRLDGELLLNWNGHKLQTYTLVKKELRAYQVDAIVELATQNYPLTVVADHIFPEIKKTLREKKIGYLDTAGNIFFPDPNHLLWIDGNKPVKEVKAAVNRAFTRTGLRTVFYLLLDKRALDYTYRELARITGVALGNITNVIAGLKAAGYILQLDEKRIKLQNKKNLLERWMVAYHENLKPTLHIGNFEFFRDETFEARHNMLKNAPTMVWGGEAAAEILTHYLTPGIITLYTLERPRGEWLNQWGLVPKTDGAVRIYDKFWRDQKWDPDQLAPPVLIYADLMMTNDPRCIEVARQIYDHYLRDELE